MCTVTHGIISGTLPAPAPLAQSCPDVGASAHPFFASQEVLPAGWKRVMAVASSPAQRAQMLRYPC